MKSFGEYLSDFTESLGLQNDNQLAHHLGVSRQYVWKLRHDGKATDAFCIELADCIGVPRGIVLLARNAAKESGAVGDAWRELAGKVASVGLMVGASLMYSPDANAGKNTTYMSQAVDSASLYYRKYLRYLREILQRIQRLAFQPKSRDFPAFFCLSLSIGNVQSLLTTEAP